MSVSLSPDKVTEAAADLAGQARAYATETALPALQTAAGTVAGTARDRGRDLWDRLSETEQLQELTRRAASLSGGAEKMPASRWPMLLAGLGTGIVLGALLGRRTVSAVKPPAADLPPPGPGSPQSADGAGDTAA